MHALEVFYLGNENIQPSMTTATQTVARGTTTTDLTVSPGTLAFGQTLTANASLASPVPADRVAPSGTITITGAGTNCTIALPATSCELVPTVTGLQGFSANYAGDANFVTSLDTAQATVNAATTAIDLSAPAAAYSAKR